MRTQKKYNWKKTIWKGLTYLVYYGAGAFLGYATSFHPEWLSLTVGTILAWVQNWTKNHSK